MSWTENGSRNGAADGVVHRGRKQAWGCRWGHAWGIRAGVELQSHRSREVGVTKKPVQARTGGLGCRDQMAPQAHCNA